jgi:uncharacterized protein (TIGR04255 family)
LKISQVPDARFWFVDATSTQLVQLQVDRFIRNWRKGGPPYDAYPRYETLRPRFEQDWTVLLAFLEREGLGPPEANMCEVTYINHVDLGAGWESLGEAHRALRFLKVQGQREALPEMPEAFSMNLRYLMPERRGRLHVSAQPVIRRSDGRPVLQLTLTARGKPESPNLRDIAAWFDLGHQWVVHGFVDLTTPEMHETWGRT